MRGPWSGTGGLGKVGQCHIQHGDVVCSGVRPGVPRTHDPCQGLTRSDLWAIQVAQEWMEPEGVLPGGTSLLLLGVRYQHRGVEVQVQLCTQVRSRPRCPRSCPGGCPPGAQGAKVGIADTIQDPPSGGVRGHGPEQGWLIPQRCQMGDVGAPIGDGHCEIRQNLAGLVDRGGLVGTEQTGIPGIHQTGRASPLCKQLRPGMAHHPESHRHSPWVGESVRYASLPT